MLHSGSRNLGKKVADYYNTVAKELNEKWYSSVTSDMQLAFLPVGTQEFKDYMAEIDYCVQFAKLNRSTMMDIIQDIIYDLVPAKFTSRIDVIHNYAKWENHGSNMIVHRKGAIHLKAGEYGLIPGSMGTASYVVKGTGCEKSLCSCSHGAGRVMGRKQAQRELDLQETIISLDSKGILHDITSTEDLEEAPAAYKNIDEVIQNQSDLIQVITKLVPIAVVKG